MEKVFEEWNIYAGKKGLIITKDYEESVKKDGIKIRFLPLWKWILSAAEG
jgi:predicted AAA+ superfamily ATPase